MIVLRRISHGVYAHFPIRKSEWGMGLAALGMGCALYLQRDMFATSPSFSVVASMAEEATWGMCALAIFFARVVALGINGSFPADFRHSPHFRLAASMIGLIFWSQFFLGVLLAAVFHGGALSGIVAYGTFCFFECCNIYQSAWDRARAKS